MDKSISTNYIRDGIFLVDKNQPLNSKKWILDINFQENIQQKKNDDFQNALKILSKNKYLINFLKKFN
jgi:hypothetical protein